MTSDHLFTWLRWYNSAPDEHGRCAKIASADVGAYKDIAYGTARHGEVLASNKPPHPEHGQWQWGIALSVTSRTLVIDVDDYDEYKLSDLELELPVEKATSYRIADDTLKLHFVVVVPPELLHLWPKQGSTAWGDVKSNGFSYVTGVHHTGSEYTATGQPVICADEALMNAISAEPRTAVLGSASGGSAGAWDAPDYAYSDGSKWVRGVADVASMVNAGMLDEDITGLMTEILKRSDGYAGNGEEVPGWIESARRKYALAEGESWAEKMDRDLDDFFAAQFGRDAWEARKVQAQEEAERSTHKQPLDYVRDPEVWLLSQETTAPEVPDLSRVPLNLLVNPDGELIEPAGTTDSYLARMILTHSAGVIRYASDTGCWLRNFGHSWEEWGTQSSAKENGRSLVLAWGKNLKSDEEVERQAAAELEFARAEWERRKAAGELTAQELEDAPSFERLDDENQERHEARLKRLARNRQRLTSNDGVGAVASMLLSEARISMESCVRISGLDSEPWVLWAGGVPWSLLSPRLSIAEGANPIHVKNCPTLPVPGPHPLWDEALAALFPDEGLRGWAVREIAGAALWGETSKQHPVLDGKPNAGKSTVTDTVRKILGNYAVDIDPDKLIGGRDSSALEEEKAAMIGARMVLLDEPPKQDRQSISQFNRIASGTGEIAAAAKYKGRVSAPKRFNLVINQNDRNRMKLDAEGVRQRLVFIPAEGHITVELYKRFMAGIRSEYPAILATLIRECALFHTGNRLEVPLSAQVALDSASDDGDEFQQWLFSSYELPAGEVPRNDEDRMPTLDPLRKAFAVHARTLTGVSALTRRDVRKKLAELGVTVRDYGGTKGKRMNVVHLYPLPDAQDIIAPR